MDVFFLLIFLAFLFVMSIGGLLYWAVMSGQFDDSDANASVILQDDDAAFRLPDRQSDPLPGPVRVAREPRPKQ